MNQTEIDRIILQAILDEANKVRSLKEILLDTYAVGFDEGNGVPEAGA